ncbi:MAG: sigma-54-dependent Fis family transcriptional regulator [Desulfobacteraceae bacterium]|nr:sigma-54-dependent Fis family transcriptional regulator [Desulfobacteraceae bacterium]
MTFKILLIEDEPSMRVGVSHALESADYKVTACESGNEGFSRLQKEHFDLIITDVRLPGMNGMEILAKAKELRPETGIILMTGFPEIDTAVSAIKKGAFDYIGKPFLDDTLLITVERFFSFLKLKLENIRLRESISEKKQFENFIGESPAMQKVFALISTIAPESVTVRIHGESGTGKELVAGALHNLSPRRDSPFIKINCAAIPENLLESELFGHEKGAFTGADHRKKGKFEAANGGTIFFDEVGDMPLTLQAKLLRVLEENEITRIGGHDSIKVDVRSVFATAKNLEDAIKEGSFRGDLYYRINIVPILLPPLRERGEDITTLTEHFLNIFTEKYNKKGLTVLPEAYRALLAHDFPGNVRELKNIVERAVLLSTGSTINSFDLPREMGKQDAAPGSDLRNELPLAEGVRWYEKRRILDALEEMEGKKIKAAEKLGISRKVLWKKIRDLGIDL